MFLDIDDTILDFNIKTKEEFDALPFGIKPANGAREFLLWCAQHFEVRWCTCWTLRGDLWPDDLDKLASAFNLSKKMLASFANPNGWRENKTESFDWPEIEAGRDFVWIEDGILSRELEILETKGLLDSFIRTNSTEDPNAIEKTKHILMWRFNLPE
jgi:hypothetical protein